MNVLNHDEEEASNVLVDADSIRKALQMMKNGTNNTLEVEIGTPKVVSKRYLKIRRSAISGVSSNIVSNSDGTFLALRNSPQQIKHRKTLEMNENTPNDRKPSSGE